MRYFLIIVTLAGCTTKTDFKSLTCLGFCQEVEYSRDVQKIEVEK